MLPDEAGLIVTNVCTRNDKFDQINLSLVQTGSVSLSQEHVTNMSLLITTSIRKKVKKMSILYTLVSALINSAVRQTKTFNHFRIL